MSGNYALQPPPPYSTAKETGLALSGSDDQPVSKAAVNQVDHPASQKRSCLGSIHDPIFLLLFILQLGGFAAVAGLALKSYITFGGLGGGLGNAAQGQTGLAITLDRHTVYLLLVIAAAAFVLSAFYLLLVRLFTKAILEITLFLNLLLNVGVAVYYWVRRYYSGAIIFTVIAIFSIIAYPFMRRRIPLAKILFQIIIDISKHHPSVYLVAILALIVQSAWNVFYAFTMVAIYNRWSPGSPACGTTGGCSTAKVTGLIIYCTFSFYWTSQVIANVALATLAGGAFGSWYYYGPRIRNAAAGEGMPRHPTLSAFGRAIGPSLGSISFGSLIVALLELIRFLINIARSNAQSDGDPLQAILWCVASCLVGCIESAIQFFNKYAYIEIALYGKAYIPAAKDTWRLLKDRGVDALVNDSLVATCLNIGSYIIGLVCALFAYLYLIYTNPSYNANGQFTPVVVFFAFAIGGLAGRTLGGSLEAGVSTIFVGLAEDPAILAMRSPALFEIIRNAYPRVVQGV